MMLSKGLIIAFFLGIAWTSAGQPGVDPDWEYDWHTPTESSFARRTKGAMRPPSSCSCAYSLITKVGRTNT